MSTTPDEIFPLHNLDSGDESSQNLLKLFAGIVEEVLAPRQYKTTNVKSVAPSYRDAMAM